MNLSRRGVVRSLATIAAQPLLPSSSFIGPLPPLTECGYGQIEIKSALHRAQIENTRGVLMSINDDSLLMPFRKMAGLPAPGDDLGGWYQYRPDYDYRHDDAGLAPGSTFGQWVSALARMHAATGDPALRDKVLRLTGLLGDAISPAFFSNHRFPAYTFDKLVCGLMDAHRLTHDPDALHILNKVTAAALPSLPGHAIDREIAWRLGKDASFLWDESYTLPENLFLVSTMGMGAGYRRMAEAYLNDATFFEPLARGEDVLGDKQAYSYINSLNSAMQAYLVGGSRRHLDAARNGFDMLERQSFATGGWGPDETLRRPIDSLVPTLTSSHNHFETPCGAYAHMKLTRYLLRATRDGRYGDSMERVLFNTVLGALPLQPDGRSFYNSDYNVSGRRIYSVHRWPCCSGTLPQVAADYGINTYLLSSGAVWVNLYLASVLRWTEGDAQISLEQNGSYPTTGQIRLQLTASKPTRLTLNLRVPAWSDDPALRINRAPTPMRLVSGFAVMTRTWRTGDTIELDLPSGIRLEPIDGTHLNTVAILAGPRVLFAVGTNHSPLTRDQALGARQMGPDEWHVDTAAEPLKLVPFTAAGDSPYTTYLTMA